MSHAGKNFGLMVAIVSDRNDPDGLGRVKFTLPTHDDAESDWTRVLSLYGGSAGSGHGAQWVPEKDDEILVGYVDGDPKVAVVLGSLFSAKQKPPTSEPDDRVFKSKNGHTVTISDASGKEQIELKTKSGQQVVLDEQGKSVTLKSTTKVIVDAPDIELGGDGSSLKALLGDTFLNLYNTHTHSVPGVGASLVPLVPAPPTVLSQFVKLKG
ncbi:MAG TPA: phage baseplate assembly protein V [Polyangiaceae bacterium]|nr:phage baseplate assembly protein V [Polyangiaceae bacterium]